MTLGLQVWPMTAPLMQRIHSTSLQHPKLYTALELKPRCGVLRCFTKLHSWWEQQRSNAPAIRSQPGPAAALLPPRCTLHSHKPKTLQEHLSCFLLGTNWGKTGVHQTQMGFIIYVVPWYVPGKEKVSLYARSRGGNATCLALQQGGKAIHPVEVHCCLQRALLFVCLSPSESSAHLQELFDFASVPFCTSPMFKECSKPIMAKTDSPSDGGSIIPPSPHEAVWPTSSLDSPLPSPLECTVSSPRSHTHHHRVSKQTSRLPWRPSSPIPW